MRRLIPSLCLLALLLTTPLSAAEMYGNAETVAAFSEARQAYDLRAAGSEPFELRAEASLETGGDPIRGSIELSWAAPDAWRESVSFGGFEQVRLVRDGKLWVHRNLPINPQVVDRLRTVLYAEYLQAGETEARLEKLQSKKVDGRRLRCARLSAEPSSETSIAERNRMRRQTRARVCFEDSADHLARVELGNAGTYDLQTPTVIGGKKIPAKVRQVAFDDSVLELDFAAQSFDGGSEALGSPIKDSTEWPWCADYQPARVQDDFDWSKQRFYTVLTVSENGEPKAITVLGAKTEAEGAAFSKTLEGLRFQPATCGGEPVRGELHLDPNRRGGA